MDDEVRKLVERLKLIEALHAGAMTEGERIAADNARQRVRSRIEEYKESDPQIEYTFKLSNTWSRKLFVALLRRYDIKPYRYYRQRHTTVMARVSKGFVDNTLWPEYMELNAELTKHLDKVAEGVINEAVFADSSEAEEIAQLSSAN